MEYYHGIIDYLINDKFHFLSAEENYCILQSTKTRHVWLIEYNPLAPCNKYKLWHKHRREDPYHKQANFKSVKDCLDHIVWHDKFYIYKRKKSHYSNHHSDL